MLNTYKICNFKIIVLACCKSKNPHNHEKFFTTLLVVSLFAFSGTSSVQAQSKKASFNEHKLEGLAIAAFRQTCSFKGNVDVKIQYYIQPRYTRVRVSFRDSKNHEIASTPLYIVGDVLENRFQNINEIKTPNDIDMGCEIRKD